MESSPNSNEPTPPWLELPREITAMILHKLGAVEILDTAEKVCTTWRSVCRDACMWRSINMRNEDYCWKFEYDIEKMCRFAVDRSQGQLIDIIVDHFATDDLLLYISQRSSQLKSLKIAFAQGITSKGLIEAIKNTPLLEELHLHYISTNTEAIEAVGRSCPYLKSFKLNKQWDKPSSAITCWDLEVFAVGKNMPELRHLQLFGNIMTNVGLKAILDGCPRLESLDLRRCFNVQLGGHLGRPVPKWIKVVRCPHEPIDDDEYYSELHDNETSDDDDDGDCDVDISELAYDELMDYYADDYMEFSDGGLSNYGYGYEYDEEPFVDW